MNPNIYIANTYLKVLTRSNSALLEPLQDALGAKGSEVFEEEFLYGPDIERLFAYFIDQGLDSWLLRYGSGLTIASHGPVGFAVLSAPNLQTALEILSDYMVIRSSAYQLYFSCDERRAECVVVDNTGGGVAGRWLIETSLRLAQQLIEGVMAHSLENHAAISFAYPEPDYKDELDALFGVDCRFNAKKNSISFPASWCQISSPISDQETFQTNLSKCRELKLALSGFEKLGDTIAFALLCYFEARERGDVTRANMPTLESLAEKYHLSTRTLNRRLKAQQTSYKELLMQARRKQATQLLENTHLTIADISYNLAYQEPANFVRAFKTWFGTTPGAWRRAKSNRNTVD